MIDIVIGVHSKSYDSSTIASFVQKYLQNNLDPDITCTPLPAIDFDLEADSITVGDVTIHRGVVTYLNKIITITSSQYSLLYYLMASVGYICTQTKLCRYLWPDRDDPEVYDSLKKKIQILRTTLKQGPGKKFITTVIGRGYAIYSSP